MLRLLLRLWWLQQRRNFHKRDAFCGVLHHLPVCGDGRELLSQLHREWGELGGEDMPALLGAGIVVGMLIPTSS